MAALVIGATACTAPRGSGAADAGPASRVEATTAAASSAAAPAPQRAVDAGPSGEPPAGMSLVPAGVYLMGSPVGRGDVEERPAHEAIVAAFFLDTTEVTMDAYAACVRAGACAPTHTEHPFCNARLEGRGNHPVNCVEAKDAEAYCASVGKRLPLEREWEWAARGGVEDRRFAWGDEPPDPHRACYMHVGGTCPVASFAPGAFGLYDMSGNVWEWTGSWFAPYPEEPATGQFRVYRGGSWSRRFPKWLRNEIRNRYEVSQWSAALGIRCARTKLPLDCPPDTAPAGRSDACVRARGAPLCEAGHVWDGKACKVGLSAELAGLKGAAPHASGEPASSPPAAPSARTIEEIAATPITRSRAPQFDDDCRAHFPGHPNAYVYAGSTFHAREPVVRASGCPKRDVGRFGTSVCCAD
jgi:formylglycine-generating enzyme required for sulfatase activity